MEKRRILKLQNTKKSTVLKRLIVTVCSILVVQICIFIVIILLTGVIANEKSNTYKRFQMTVSNRGECIQKYLTDKQQIVAYFREQIKLQISQVLQQNGKNVADLNTDATLNDYVLSQISDNIKSLLETSKATGSYIILDGYSDSSDLRSGLYIRNSMGVTSEDKYYTLMRGSSTLAEELGISINSNWRSEFRIMDRDESNYYTKLYNVTKNQPQYMSSQLGYWSPAFTLYGDTEQIITYSIPLLDESNNFYGVLGIDISVNALMEKLPYYELNENNEGSYYIAYGQKGEASYKTFLTSSSTGKGITGTDGRLRYKGSMIQNSIYHLQTIEKEDYVGNVKSLNLYGAESPFSSEQWVVIGVQKESDLLASYRSANLRVIIAFILSSLFTVICMWYYGFFLIRHLKKLMFFIRESSPEKRLKLNRLNISEFDDLAEAIEEMNERIGTSSAKLAEIIDMVKVPVGAIEYQATEPYVFCTQSAFDILEIHYKDKANQYIRRKAFDMEMAIIRKKLIPYKDEEDTYQMTSKNGEDKWIRIKTKERDGRVLIAVLDISNEIMEKQKIEYERDYDILTRLLNRNAFRTKMGQMLKRGNLGIGAVIMLDLDNLKYFNDTYGHDYGDKYIREAAAILSTLNQHNALVSRMSGDEFLIFISGYSNKDEIRELIKDVHKRLRETTIWVPSGEYIKLRASAGIAWYPDDGIFLDELLKYADFAMYEIKGSIKGYIKEFNKETYLKDSLLFTGREELNQLLDDPEAVRYAFQPIVDAVTGEIFGYEALMRPQIDSLRSPQDVMRLAKAQSKLYQIEQMTWISALADIERQRKLGDHFKIFINSVPNHVLLEEDTRRIEQEYGHLLERLVVEIIENEQTDKYCMEVKRKWAREHDAEIALDDFGTGYSNESTLLYINPNYVKIDMSIISNIHLDESRQKIVQNLLAYTKSHGIKVIAEGIDSYEEMETLISFGVDYMQGWYFAKAQLEIQDLNPILKEQIRECAARYQKEDSEK